MPRQNPKNCAQDAKKFIQALEFGCYGSLQNYHTNCNTGHNPLVVDTTWIKGNIDIIAKNSNCTAVSCPTDFARPWQLVLMT